MRARHHYEHEPCTLTADYIVRLLLDADYPRSAALVKRLDDDTRDKNLIEMKWREDYNKLLARLHVYEPPQRQGGGSSGRPGEMSDG